MLTARAREFPFLLPDEAPYETESESEPNIKCATAVDGNAFELEGLLNVIRRGILERGFYVAMDDRVRLICGPNTSFRKALTQRDVLDQFAMKHGWIVEPHDTAIIFRANANIDDVRRG